MIIKRFGKALQAEKGYILFATILFVTSGIYGALFFEQIQIVMHEAGIFDRLEQVVKKIEQAPTFATAFSTIFLNNVSATLFAMGSGLFFGIFPMIMLISNGLLISVALMESAAKTDINPFFLFVTTILPHGIFELPAILIGAALGVRLGLAMIRLLVALFAPKKREQSMMEWKGIRSRLFIIAVGVIFFLFFAAIVESGLIMLMYSFK